jgi:hypothetical protein
MPKDGDAPAIGGTGVGPGPAVPFGRRERNRVRAVTRRRSPRVARRPSGLQLTSFA